jgi:hypothetical protein
MTVAYDSQAAVAYRGGSSVTEIQAPKSAASSSLPKWEAEARDRLRAAIRQASKALQPLIASDAVEGNTRMFVTQFLCDGLGYDLYEDLTAEFQVKGEFADYGVRIDKQLVAFVEVKRATTKLSAKHLRQVEMYAINEGVEWAFLTNGQDWEAYHLMPRQALNANGPLVEVDLTLQVNLLGDETPTKKIDKLLYLTRESLKRRQIDDLWKAKRATSPKSLAQILCSDVILEAMRKEVRRTTGHKAEIAEIRDLLKNSVVRPECLG